MAYKVTVLPTKFTDALVLVPEFFEDFRGQYVQLYDTEDFRKVTGKDLNFVQDGFSVSRKDVIRGFHGDFETWKLVSVLSGTIYNVIVDYRPGSSTFLKWEGFVLSAENKHRLLIPPGFGNGILALSDNATYLYKQTSHYVPFSQFTLKWDDPRIGVDWPCYNPILSQRDAGGYYPTHE